MMNLCDALFLAQIGQLWRRIYDTGMHFIHCYTLQTTVLQITGFYSLIWQVFYGDYCTDKRMYVLRFKLWL